MNPMTKAKPDCDHACVEIPDFERLKFFYGQLLGVADFQIEQRFFLDKLRLHNRCFHGVGIVCGLEVDPVPTPEDCESEDEQRRAELEEAIARLDAVIAKLTGAVKQHAKDDSLDQQLQAARAEKEHLERLLEELPDCYPSDKPASAEVYVHCGWALDCNGREIVVRQPQRVDLWKLLSATQIHDVKQKSHKEQPKILVELSICYCEQPTYPSRPILTDTCVPVSKCVYGRIREGFKFRVSLEPGEPDKRCSTCCEECEDECVVLAHIHWDPSRPITAADIDWRPRRAVGVYQPTVITGISWLHGATYTPDQAETVLGTNHTSDGIEVSFSSPVYAETLQPGVVDLWRIHGGKGMSGVIAHIEGAFVDKPDSGLVRSFKYRDESGESLNKGDRVLIIIRSSFILDECCQPVDGEHIGGRVPQLEGYAGPDEVPDHPPPAPPCIEARRQPWTSGNGRPGATFESWFFIHPTAEKAS